MTESLTFHDTLLSELIFSPSLVKVRLSSSFFPSDTLLVNSKWVMLQFSLGCYVVTSIGYKAKTLIMRRSSARDCLNKKVFDMVMFVVEFI